MLKPLGLRIYERQSAPESITLTPHPKLLNPECVNENYLIRYSHGDNLAFQVSQSFRINP